VPGDPTQVIYVWFDALANYITALDFGRHGALYEDWWCGSDERQHVIGKGIIRFHAIYWPAILLSARQPVADDDLCSRLPDDRRAEALQITRHRDRPGGRDRPLRPRRASLVVPPRRCPARAMPTSAPS
jgi:hypothetical protein